MLFSSLAVVTDMSAEVIPSQREELMPSAAEHLPKIWSDMVVLLGGNAAANGVTSPARGVTAGTVGSAILHADSHRTMRRLLGCKKFYLTPSRLKKSSRNSPLAPFDCPVLD